MIKCVKSVKRIQKVEREYLTKKKVTATAAADSMINNLFKEVLDKIPEEKKVGRPRKLRKPVGCPCKNQN